MTPERTEKLLRRFRRAIRQQWLRAISAVDASQDARVAAERFADLVIRQAILAGYAEAGHLKGVFDPTSSAGRFRAERAGIVSRFLVDAQRVRGGFSSGLSARQLRDLRAYAATLEAATLGAIDFGERPTFQSAESRRMLRRVERAMVQQRADLIARTQATAALHLGLEVAVEQTETVGMGRIVRRWVTASDEKVRSSHATLNGQIKFFNEPFISGNGYQLMRPGDPNAPIQETANCRCMLITETAS